MEINLKLTPEQANTEDYISKYLATQSNIPLENLHYRWKKRSIDARKRDVVINGIFEVSEEAFPEKIYYSPLESLITDSATVHIIGAGPAGLFAALRALELGIKPIIFERGKDVRSRRRDLAILNKEGIVNPESNYCYGEGGAGTYSDGKLYTRSKKRGDVQKSLEMFVHFGAERDILVDAHPHIGTNKLPQIIVEMREEIIKRGGEVHFDSKLTDILLKENKITQIEINSEQKIDVENLILATGHSARDIFELLHRRKIELRAKSFAMGVRIEHSQALIDKIQYHNRPDDGLLPPASYAMVSQVDERGVFSFCMCPGGIIAPCATDTEEVVTNGWSPSKRNNPYANSGIVVSVNPEDFESIGPFTCLDFQKEIEHKCWVSAGKNQKVPAQRMIDFIDGKVSVDFPKTSYQPGITSVDLNKIFPNFITKRLKIALKDFGNKMQGYLTNEAVLHAPESRTSSPVQIPRDRETLQHISIINLYPCAEGAGYAGGIISAAIDGMNCMDAINKKIETNT